MEAQQEEEEEELTARDAHGFLVPRNLLSKFKSLQTRTSASAATHKSADWAELLAQAARKDYRAGGPLPPRFVAAVSEGIPTEHRAAAWMLLSGAQQRRDAQPQLYDRLVALGAMPGVEETIDLDVRRTFPEHARLTPAFCAKMRRVLLAYARRNPEVSYCQGMNFVCASILLFVEREEDAFWLLSHLVEQVLPDHYVQSMIGHTVDQHVTEQLVSLYLPDLAAHLRSLGLSMPFVTTHWFLCLFVTALPSETAFRLWDLILCLDASWTFRAALALFATMEAQELLDATDLGTAVFVIKSSTRAAFDVAELISLASSRFQEVSGEVVARLRRDWRRTTMEAMHARLRVKELYEAQQQVGTFAVEQTRSLLLSLHLEGRAPDAAIPEAEIVEALGRVLPEEETAVVVAFLRSTADGGGRGGEAGAGDDAAGAGGAFHAAQVAVGMAVLCDGPVDERLRICFEAFDTHGGGSLGAEEIIRLLHAIYRTYYKQPPDDAEVRTAAEVIFLNLSPGGKGGKAGGSAGVSVDAFGVLAMGQPTLVQCFAMRGQRPLLTPRGVDQRNRPPAEPPTPLEQLVPFFLPTCGAREKTKRHPIHAHHVNPGASRGPFGDDKRLAAAAAEGRAAAAGGGNPILGLGSAMLDGIGAIGRTVLSGTTDAFGGLGGALDGALSAMEVPLKRNPLGERIRDADELAMALSEAGLEPPRLRVALGFDCAAHNRRAGRQVFSGKPLHASSNAGVVGPDPNPYQLAIFMLGKAFESVGLGGGTPVRCFCYNTLPPQTTEWPLAPGAAAPGWSPGAEARRRRGGGGAAGSSSADAMAAAAARLREEADGEQEWAEPVETQGMEGVLTYYNALPPYIFRGARGSGAAGGFAQAVEYGARIAQGDAADGATRTLLLLLTPGQGIDAHAARQALTEARDAPLSVVVVGVGDGPFHELGRLVAAAPLNLNAVDFHAATSTKFPDRALALEALRTLPEQQAEHSARGREL